METATTQNTTNTNEEAQEEGVDFEETLERGIELYREINAMKSELSDIKSMIREHAEAVRVDEKTVELRTSDGEQTVDVTFPKDSLKVKADNEDMEALNDRLGELLFDMFFKTKVKYSAQSEFEDNVGKLDDPIQQQAVKHVVEKKARTPRVKFPK